MQKETWLAFGTKNWRCRKQLSLRETEMQDWMVEVANQKPQNMSHKGNNENKMKDRNPWKEFPNKKQNEKETSNKQLNKQQDQCPTSNIESAPSNNALVRTLDVISNNNFDKDFDNSIITNSSMTNIQLNHFFIRKPTCLIRDGWNKTKSVNKISKTLKKELCKIKKKTKNVEEIQPTPASKKGRHTEQKKYI